MSRRRVNAVAPILIALVMAMPVAARVGTDTTKLASASMQILNTISLGGTQIKPGTYKVIADDSKVTLEQNGKMVAQAPVVWKEGSVKAIYSNIVTIGDQVTEIHFGGKMRYVAIAK